MKRGLDRAEQQPVQDQQIGEDEDEEGHATEDEGGPEAEGALGAAVEVPYAHDRDGDEQQHVQQPHHRGRALSPGALRAVALPDGGRVVVEQRVPRHQ